MSKYSGTVEFDLYLSQQNFVLLDGLKSNLLGGTYLDSATTTFELTTLANASLTTTTMSYATGSAGRYEGTISAISSLVEGTDYLGKITVTSGATTVAYWELRRTASYRRD